MSQTTCLPGVLECGDSADVTETFTDFPAPTWSISLFLNPNNGTNATNVAGTGNNSSWSFSVPAATTANLTPGVYDYAYYATNGSNRQTAKTGQITFIPNLTAAVAKSQAQTMLDALNATILALAGSGNQSVSFNGQSYSKRDMTQLMAMRRELEAEVYREQKAAANLRGVSVDPSLNVIFGTGSTYGPYPWTPFAR